MFIVVAVVVGALVDLATQRSLEARRARLEAEALVRSTTSLAIDPEPIQRLVEQIRSTFDLAGARLEAAQSAVATTPSSSPPTVTPPAEPTVTLGLASGTLTLYGGTLSSDDERLLQALADQLSLAIDNQALAAEAKEAAALADIDAVRTAMLRAVSHDLRTPLASIKAMVSGLRDSTVAWTPDQIAEALVTVDEETDRLTMLVGNLLDASRLQIGALAINVQPTQVADVVAAALHSANLPERARPCRHPGRPRSGASATAHCSNEASPTSSPTPNGSARSTSRCGSRRRRSATTSTSGSSTGASASPPTNVAGSSSRSSGSATFRSATGWDWGCRSPTDSSRRWVAR